MTQKIRLHNFLKALNHYMTQDVAVIDFDENGNCIYDDDEDFTYKMLVSEKEWRLLGAETVKKYIHMWYTDWSSMSKILEAEKIY